METLTNSRLKPGDSAPKTSLNKLYRALYVACQSKLPDFSKGNADAVKAFRDQTIEVAYGKGYDELTASELNSVIAVLNAGESIKTNFASRRMINALQRYMFSAALIWADMKDWEYVNPADGKNFTGEKLRELLTEQFYGTAKKLPENIVKRMYIEWINPKSNTMLMKGGYKQLIRNSAVLYWDRLTVNEVRYLITRYTMMCDNALNKTVKPVQPGLN